MIDYQEIANKCKSKADFCRALGIVARGGNYKRIDNIIRDHNLDISHFSNKPWNYGIHYTIGKKLSLEEILVEDTPIKNNNNLKKKLFKAGLKKEECEVCGYKENLELHHINGDNCDNRIENLQILCPNCHAKTDTFRGLNLKSKRNHLTPEDYIISDEEYAKKIKDKNEARRKKNVEIKSLPKCKYCGKEFKPRRGLVYCSLECYNNDRCESSRRPNMIDLIQSFKDLRSFTKVAESYGVSDNAVRKWCKVYGIPEHTSDIIDYINTNFSGNIKPVKKTEIKEIRKVVWDMYDKNLELIETFDSRTDAGQWLIDNGFSKTKDPKNAGKHLSEVGENYRYLLKHFWKKRYI